MFSGVLSDYFGKRKPLAVLGYGLGAAAKPLFALASTSEMVRLAMSQGLLATMVAGTVPSELRGTAFGFFNLASGAAMLLASVIAGLLWDQFGATFTFVAGGAFGCVSLLLIVIYGGVWPSG